jgi:hypothetical protein
VPQGGGIEVPKNRASPLAVQDSESTAAGSRINLSNPRSARGLASQPKVVALREVDANLQEINA